MPAWRSPHIKESAHRGKRNALLGAIALSLLAFLMQIGGAWYTGSLALLGDSAHLFTDLLSLIMSLSAVILATRPTSDERSFGLYRLEVLASFVNGLLLLLVAASLAYECVLRIREPAEVKALPLVAVASAGLLFNLISAWLLHNASKGGEQLGHHHHHHGHEHGHDHSHHHEDLHADRNLRSALLHVWSDALGSVAVIAGAGVIYLTGLNWVDAAVGLVLALWIFRWSWRVIFDSAHVLLESTPAHVNNAELSAGLCRLDARVQAVEDLHVWELTSRMYAATAELRVEPMSLEEAESLRARMHEWLRERYGIMHVVLAFRPHAEGER